MIRTFWPFVVIFTAISNKILQSFVPRQADALYIIHDNNCMLCIEDLEKYNNIQQAKS